jgi:TetR/AcrR family tetracycline transcriptional repressor
MSELIQSRRGRPPKISRDRVVEAAIELGLDRFSMDDVAERLDVTTPALYTHVSGRDEIVRLGASVVISRSAPCDQDWFDWQSWLRSWTTTLRRDLGSVGGELLDAVRDGLDVSQLDVAEEGIALMLAGGLSPTEAGHTLWLAARIAFSVGASGASAVGQVAAAARATSAARPLAAMASAMDAVVDADNDEAFAFDLDVLIAGVESRLVP